MTYYKCQSRRSNEDPWFDCSLFREEDEKMVIYFDNFIEIVTALNHLRDEYPTWEYKIKDLNTGCYEMQEFLNLNINWNEEGF